jgi:hypothetical protein
MRDVLHLQFINGGNLDLIFLLQNLVYFIMELILCFAPCGKQPWRKARKLFHGVRQSSSTHKIDFLPNCLRASYYPQQRDEPTLRYNPLDNNVYVKYLFRLFYMKITSSCLKSEKHFFMHVMFYYEVLKF